MSFAAALVSNYFRAGSNPLKKQTAQLPDLAMHFEDVDDSNKKEHDKIRKNIADLEKRLSILLKRVAFINESLMQFSDDKDYKELKVALHDLQNRLTEEHFDRLREYQNSTEETKHLKKRVDELDIIINESFPARIAG